VSICDIYVAVTSPNRPYKEPWSPTKALEYIKAESGKTFCPNLTDTFQNLFSQVA
jgi:HD-GYP domain-containing protein (c-di-GMP phosphodiesterase class II)